MSVTRIQYRLKESIVAATISKRPLIVVEGKDDISFYKKLISSNLYRILSSELIQNSLDEYYTPGCEGVIKIVTEVLEFSVQNPLCLNYFLGIIDCDCRSYIETQNISLPNLFRLKYYSYESHFISWASGKRFIQFLTNATQENLSSEIYYFFKPLIDSDIYKLYIASLDALKGRCDDSYDSLSTYETNPETLYQLDKNTHTSLIDKIFCREQELLNFAEEKGITFAHKRNVIKGKWYLYAYAKNLYENLPLLSNQCKNALISQCDYCQNQHFENCVWKPKMSLNRNQFVNTIIEINIEYEPELNYIKDKISTLGLH